MKEFLLLFALIGIVASFTFLYPSISMDILTINTVATYEFFAARNSDNNLNPTPYSTQLVPASSTIVIMFPSQYNLTKTVPSCSSLVINDNPVAGYSTSISANNVTISNAVPSALAIANVTVVCSNVTNPYPAITTDPFVIVIGQDVSANSTTVTLTPASFQVCNVSFSPAFVNTTGAMVLYLKPQNDISNNGYVAVQFPSNLQWAQDVSTSHSLPIASSTCTILSGQVQTGSCAGLTATATVDFTITSLNATTLTLPFSFQINGLFSPPTTSPPDTMKITSYSSSNAQIDTCTASITGLQPQQLSVALVANLNPLIVNSATSLTFTFTLTDTLTKTDYFQISFPTGSLFSFVVISAVNLQLFSSGVTYISSNLTLIMRQSAASPTKYAGTVCKISISSYTAPPSTKQTGNLLLQVFNYQNYLKMQGSASLAAQPNTFLMSIAANNYLINQNAAYTVSFTSTDFLTNTSYILLTFPSDLTLNISAHCMTSNLSSPASSTCASSGSNTIRLDSLTTAGISANTYTLTIQSIVNPNRAVSDLSFYASFYYLNDSSYLTANANFTGLTFVPNLLSANSSQVVLSDYHVIATPVSANITFTTKDAVPANGYLLITIPVQISIVSGYSPQCIYTSGIISAMASCSVSGQVFNVSFGSRVLLANQTITLSLNSFGVNPKSTRPTSSFQFYLYSPDGYLINYINSSLAISTLIPVDFSFVSITASNYSNAATNAYSFFLQQPAPWDNSSYVIIQLPPSISPSSNSPICTNVNSNTALSCSVLNSTNINISLTAAASSISLSVASLINSPSYRTSSYFTITSYTSDGYIYAVGSSVSITTTSPSSFTSLAYAFSNPYYNTTTNLTLNIVNTAVITNTYTLSNINQFNAGSNLSCISQTSAPLCYLNGSTLFISSNGTAFPVTNDITILNLFVPMANVTSMVFKSYDSSYLMSTYSPISFQTICSLPCYTCQSASTPTICLSCYPDTLFTNRTYYSLQNCYTSCPAGTLSVNSSLTCSSCSSFCAECSLSSTNCTECVANSSYPILYLVNSTCASSCPSGTYQNNSTNLTKYTPVCSPCIYPCSTCITASICTSCSNPSLFYYQNQCLVSCPVNVTVANITSMQCQMCASICSTCINTTTTCLACNASVAPIYYQQNQTCVSSCPSPLVVDGTICSPCASPCNTCSVSKANCTSCVNGSYLSMVQNGSCLTVCDKNYFANATTLQCQLCSSVSGLNCKNCLNSTNCITCDPGFVFFTLNSSCLSQTPIGYANISGIAVACTANCSQCNQVSYNCTACTGVFNLYLFAGTGFCNEVCPNTTLVMNNTCTSCTYPCLTCTNSLNNCSSCFTGYLIQSNSSYICITACPNTTFLNDSTSICTNCSSPCLSCFGSSSQCTSCINSSYYTLNFTCVSSCPNNSIIDSFTKSCYSCISPCLNCAGFANNCTSCESGYYFYQTASQCLSACPANISVADPNGTFTCVSCSNNCLTCSLIPSNCSSCPQNYSYFSHSCLSACPSGMYSASRICSVCSNNCSTCSSATTCLTCSGSTLFYQSQCLSSCPVSASIIVNSSCISCSNACLNCSKTDVCYQCPPNAALFAGACVTSCPAPLDIYFNTSSNRLDCFTQSEIAVQNLQNTLQVTSVLPLPFTILSTFLFLCCLMSKLQNVQTYVTGVGYSLYGCAEVGALSYLLYIYSIGYVTSSSYSQYHLLFLISLAFILLLNFISLTCVTPFLTADPEFNNWLKHRPRGTPQKDSIRQESIEDVETTGSEKQNDSVECCSHYCTFVCFTIISFLISYKFRVLIFTKLFRFNCLTAHMQNIHGFRAFNVLSFFGIVHEGIACFITIRFLLIYGFADNRLYLASIDCLIVTLISFILALLATQKDEDFFKVHNDFKDGVDLGHRKKDKERLKNLKIDEKRLKGMDSRNKLIDVNDEHSEAEEEIIIVNHNITGPAVPKKVGSNWVEVDENRRKRSPRNSREKQTQNIFEIQNEFEEEGAYMPMTERQRIDLFHSSVRPVKLPGIQPRLQSSRVDDWVEVNLDHDQSLKFESKVKEKPHRKVEFKTEVQDLEPTHSKQLNLQPFVLSADLSERFSKLNSKPPRTSGARPIIMQIESQDINQSGSNQGLKAKDKSVIRQQIKVGNSIHILSELPAKDEEIIVIEPNIDLNQTIEKGQIADSSGNKSYESVLPFVHEAGILRQKKLKKKEEPKQSNLMIVNLRSENGLKIQSSKKPEKIDMAITAKSALFDDGSRIQGKQLSKAELPLQDLLNISEIKETVNPKQTQKVEKVAQEVQVEDLEPLPRTTLPQQTPISATPPIKINQISPQKLSPKPSFQQAVYKPPLPAKIPKQVISRQVQSSFSQDSLPIQSKKLVPQELVAPLEAKKPQSKVRSLGFTSQQMDQKIEPQRQMKESNPIVHAPKVYKSSRVLGMDGNTSLFDEFDDQLHKREEELERIKLEVAKNNNQLLQKQQEYSRSRKKSRSRHSVKSYLDEAIEQRKKNTQNNPNLIVIENLDQNTRRTKTNQQQNEIQAISVNQPSIRPTQKSNLSEKMEINNRSGSRRSAAYDPSEISKPMTEKEAKQEIAQQQSRSYQRNIFDQPHFVQSYQEDGLQPPSNHQASKSIVDNWENDSVQRQQNNQISRNRENLKSSSSLKSAKMLSEQQEVEGNYVINVKQEQNTGKIQKQSEAISYQPSQSSHHEQLEQQSDGQIDQGEVEDDDISNLEGGSNIDHQQVEENVVEQPQAEYQAKEPSDQQQMEDQEQQESEKQAVKQQQIQSVEHSQIKKKSSDQSSEEIEAAPRHQLPSNIIDAKSERSEYFEANQQQNHPQRNSESDNQNRFYAEQEEEIEEEPMRQNQLNRQNTQILLQQQTQIQKQKISIHNDYQVEERDDRYEQSQEQSQQKQQQENLESPPRSSQPQQALFRVEYAQGNLDPEQISHKEFTVENVNQDYFEVENANSSQGHQISLELRKTSKKYPRLNRNIEEEPESKPIRFSQGKSYIKSEIPDEEGHTVLGKIKRSQNKQKIQQQETARDPSTNRERVADLLKNVVQKRSKKSMPKEERDERILIKMDNSNAPKLREPHQNTNLTRKSMEKNKPINQFKFQHKQEEYGQEEEYQSSYRKPIPKNMTNPNLVKPFAIDRSSSLRESKQTSHFAQKQISQVQNNAKPRQAKIEQIRQFDFGDEFSSDRSKNPASSEAELVKWKQQFMQNDPYINISPEQERNYIPERPIVSRLHNFDESDELEVIEQRKISRRKSKRSKQKSRRESKGRNDDLHKIYGQ